MLKINISLKFIANKKKKSNTYEIQNAMRNSHHYYLNMFYCFIFSLFFFRIMNKINLTMVKDGKKKGIKERRK